MDIKKPDIDTNKRGRRGGRIFSPSQKLVGGTVATSTARKGRRAELKTDVNNVGEQFASLDFYEDNEKTGQVISGNLYEDETYTTVLRRFLALISGRAVITEDQDGLILTDSDFIPYPGFTSEILPPSLGWSTSVGHPGDSPWRYVVALNPLVTLSDARRKDDIADTVYGLREILSLRPVSFRLKGQPRVSLGFIAQEVKDIIPEAVFGSEEKTYSMTYETIIPVLVKAIQEQQAQIAQLTADVEALRRKAVQ